jgi:predicted  nucleic acid-binding Zn-ribbon protein
MPIQIPCSGCGTIFNVEEKHIGRTGRCIKCGLRFLIVHERQEFSRDDAEESVNSRQPNIEEVDQGNSQTKRTYRVRPATPKQKEFATDLGIKFDENISAREISALIDAALARQDAIACREIEIEAHLKTLRECEPEEMVGQIANRGLNTLLIIWPKPEFRSDSKEVTFKLINSDDMAKEDVHYGLAFIMLQILDREGLDFMQYCAKYLLPRAGKNLG